MPSINNSYRHIFRTFDNKQKYLILKKRTKNLKIRLKEALCDRKVTQI